MTSFFRMHKSELWFLVSLILFSAASFLPMWRDIYVAGMSLFGWWMAALMILSPMGALLTFLYERKRSDPGASSSR